MIVLLGITVQFYLKVLIYNFIHFALSISKAYYLKYTSHWQNLSLGHSLQ